MTDKLTEICNSKREIVAKQKMMHSFADMDRMAATAPLARPFASALLKKIENQEVGLICEIKKASPSAGLIRPDFNPTALAQAYQEGGAACLSILTEENYFQGSDQYLIEARASCDLPVLRKDFMVDLWQIAQSRAIGADCVLLIMAALDDGLAQEMHAAAYSYGMNALIEVHNPEEMERALRLPCGLIGINNRNLKTLKIDLNTTERLAAMVPENQLVVSESGLKTAEDLRRMQDVGVHCFLIGESLMRQEDVAQAVRNIK